MSRVMAISNHERVGKALEILISDLKPLVERELKNICHAVIRRSNYASGTCLRAVCDCRLGVQPRADNMGAASR
jgi:hypothetical protein